MKAIIFDLGGTLDTDGIHWGIKFWQVYQRLAVPVERQEYMDSYVYSEKNVPGIIAQDDGLFKTICIKIFFQLKYLKSIGRLDSVPDIGRYAASLAEECIRDVNQTIDKHKDMLKELHRRYSFALVSNYYGNVDTILRDMAIDDLFEVIIDSYNINIRKPDPGIFSLALEKLCLPAKETYLVGDVYEKDIQPGKVLGCKTIWLKNQCWSLPEDESDADHIISSLSRLSEVIDHR